MNEPEDPESTSEQNASSDASATSMPWHLPGAEELVAPDVEVQQADKVTAEVNQNLSTKPLLIWCPDCGQEMHISREHLGMQGACLNCHLPIVANMRPDEDGSMRVKASKVGGIESDSPVVAKLESGDNEAVAIAENEVSELETGTGGDEKSEDVKKSQEDMEPLLTEESSLKIPLPSWMVKSLSEDEELDGEKGEIEITDEAEDGFPDEGVDDIASDEEGNDLDVAHLEEEQGEEESYDEAENDEVVVSDVDLDEEAASPEIPLPSWMTGSSSEESENDISKPIDHPDDADETDVEEKDDDAANYGDAEDEHARSWVKGGNPWQGSGSNMPESDEDKEEFPSLLPEVKIEEKTTEPECDDVEISVKNGEEDEDEEEEESKLGLIIAAMIILLVGGGGLTAFLKPDLFKSNTAVGSKALVENTDSTKSAEKSKQDKPAIEKPVELDAGNMVNSGDEQSQEEQLSNNEPKAVERPHGQTRKEVQIPATVASSAPQMATTRAEIHDGVALRMHQEGERTIRSFYRAGSVEERSAFVLQPSKALEQMRAFYAQSGALPNLRYVEFVGLVSDPTSGFRFGVFDVHEKESETSHRWSVVEVDPGRYAMDWGLYEQLEGATLTAYLAKPRKDPKKFRLLMKLGESVLVQDSPWSEEAIKVYLQLPLASSGAETILIKRSMAKKMGILSELAGGKMKIGQIEIEWLAGDKDPGSKVPTITALDGWGAWSKFKMRGLK